jgi:ribonuclease HII
MDGLAVANPAYGWERNRGYATAEHREAIKRVGVTCHHRRTFAPVRVKIEARNKSPDCLLST